MAKIKIQTARPGNYGRPVSFGNVTLTFDKLGFAEVEESVAKKLAEKYQGWLFIGASPKPEIKPDNAEELAAVKKENEDLKAEIKKLEGTNRVTDEAADGWKEDLLKAQTEAKEAVDALEAYKAATKRKIEELELNVQLAGKTVAMLQETCEKLEIPVEKYKGKTKDDLIKLILDESRQK